MATAKEIRDHLAQFVDGKISLHQFEDWFVPATWNIRQQDDPEAETLADDIELRISEHSDGVLNERELVGELTRFARPPAPRSFRYVVLDHPQKLFLPLEPLILIRPKAGTVVLGSRSSVESRDLYLALEPVPAAS